MYTIPFNYALLYITRFYLVIYILKVSYWSLWFEQQINAVSKIWMMSILKVIRRIHFMCVRTNWDICVHTLYVCTDIHNLICTHWRRHLWAGTFVKREVNNSTRLFLCASAFVFYGKKNKKQRWGQRQRQRPRQRQRQRQRRAKQVAKRVNGGRRSKDGDADEQRQQREKDRKRELGRQREKESGDGKQARRQQVAWRFSLPVCGGLQTHIHAHMHRAERKRDPHSHMHTRQHIISYTYRQTYVNGETTAKQTTTTKKQQQQ